MDFKWIDLSKFIHYINLIVKEEKENIYENDLHNNIINIDVKIDLFDTINNNSNSIEMNV